MASTDRLHGDTDVRLGQRAANSSQHPYFSFADIIAGDFSGAIHLRQHTQPKIVGGKVAIVINEEEYVKSLAQFCCCLIGLLVLLKGDRSLMTKGLKIKLCFVGNSCRLVAYHTHGKRIFYAQSEIR